jgi:hypothetical protein
MTDKVVESKKSTKPVADTKAVKQSKEYAEAKKQEMRRRMAAFSDCC